HRRLRPGRHRQGWRHGPRRLPPHRPRDRRRYRTGRARRGCLALGGRAPRRGRRGAPRRGHRLRGHGPRLGPGPPDLRGARPRRRRSRLRPALTDVVIMAPTGKIFVTGPDVVRSVTGEHVDMEGLGGQEAHHRKSGVCHIAADDERDALNRARRLVTLLSAQGDFDTGAVEADQTDLAGLLPDSPRRAYDVRPLVHGILDSCELDGSSTFEELQAKWAPSIVVGFGRMAGRTVGVIANNPLRLGGCLNSESAEKASRFVRLCDAFGVPLLVVVDVPGYLPGVSQEWEGVVRRGAKLLHAFAEASVARVTLVPRKIYGGAYIAMNSRALGASAVFAWPDAEVAVMGAKAAVGILHKRTLAAAPEDEREALHDRLADEHAAIAGGVGRAVSIGVVDEVIEPTDTRRRLVGALDGAAHARGDHKNIPL